MGLHFTPGVPPARYPIDLDAELTAFIAKGGLRKFPIPTAAIEAGNIMWDINYRTDALAKAISKDKELAAEVLRRVSTAASGFAGRGASVATAVSLMGAEQTAFLLVAHRYGQQIAVDGPLLPLRARAWREGLISARLCEVLASARKLPRQEAYLCGLNHDIGRSLTAGCIEMITQGRTSFPPMPESFWLDVIDRHHVAVGLELAKLAQMPATVRAVIEAHHLSSFDGLPQTALLEIVHIADAINQSLADECNLSHERLAAIPGLRSDEIALLLDVVAKAPRFVADMERHAKKPLWGLITFKPLILPEPENKEATQPLGVSLTCASIGKPTRYQTQAVAADRLRVVGDVPLKERFITEVSVDIEPPVSFWAEIMSCREHERLFHIELRPFALGPQSLAGWNRLAGAAVSR